MTDEPAVHVQGLNKSFGQHRALRDVDLRIDGGRFVALVGPNGAGKSTLLRCLVRSVEPDAGSIRIDGVEMTQLRRRGLRRARVGVGFVFQRFGLVPRCSAFQNVLNGAMGREGFRVWRQSWSPAAVRAEAMQCLDRVGMADVAAQRADTLSGGQAQRVAIARMLMQRPKLVLADEPVASLDPAASRSILDLLRSFVDDDQLTVVAALHQMDLANEFADRVVGLRDGVVALDEPRPMISPGRIELLYAAGAS